ncbi:MAG: aldehyde dehydrogenase (NADP(+)) [Planctomycetota bacterium]
MSTLPLRGTCVRDGVEFFGGGARFSAVAAATGERLLPEFADATVREVNATVAAAVAAADTYAAVPREQRAQFLRAIASELVAAGDALLLRAELETALPRARLIHERGRTVFQLETFAKLLDEGSWVDARIDRADETRQPQRKPDLRAMLVPMGPVAVFGSSNFPFAYSVAGGDTASALAVGCPVVVKAHPMHPGTSEGVARAIVLAMQKCQIPSGAFGLVHGHVHDVGRALVEHPGIAAVGFTGSVAGGTALARIASARREPIPVFAEMGSVNPVFVLPGALRERGVSIAAAVASSMLLACGQFCTSPGMVLWCEGEGSEEFASKLAASIGSCAPAPMVHPNLAANFARAVKEVRSLDGVVVRTEVARTGSAPSTAAAALLVEASAEVVLAEARLREEIYGPATVAVRCRSAAEMVQIANALHGHLTATVHGTERDFLAHAELLSVLRRRVGRLVHNGVPTGVEVATAMQHGGPWPSSTDPRFTAVGPRSVLRWVRPLCWQDAPMASLPPELREGNPCGIRRTVDGVTAVH